MSAAVAVITMVRDEEAMLPRWLTYYGRQFGRQSLVVLDNGTTDGSTTGLDVSVLQVPEAAAESPSGGGGGGAGQSDRKRPPRGFDRRRAKFVSDLAAGLLEYVNAVIYVDVDEFLVPHPRLDMELADYISQLRRPVTAAVGLNLIHQPHVEGPFDSCRGILEQRRFVKFVPRMCKPAIKRVPAPWSGAFHGCRHEYEVDPDLLLLHTKFFDVEATLAAQQRRFQRWQTGIGAPRSTWQLDAADMIDEMASWRSSDPGSAAELRIDHLDLSVVAQETIGGETYFVSRGGTQLRSMRRGPLYQLPTALSSQF